MPRVLTARTVADLVAPALTAESSDPTYGRLTEALRHLIADGRLPEGSRLPSERDLPGPLGLSRTTVTRAYTELRAQGYLRTRRGSGSVVQVPDVPGGRIDHLLTPSALSDGAIDLTCTAAGAPGGTSEAYEQALEELAAYLPGTGYYPGGVPVLREVVAARYSARGLATTPDQVIVAPGALAGVAIAARGLLPQRERVLVETPTYPNAIATLEGAGARIVAHPIDHERDDWDVGGLGRALRQSGARVAYLIPDFHNPTGALMPSHQRAEVGRMLRAASVVPIIDESIVDLPLDGQPVPEPLGRHVPDAITVGSVSKWLWGGLRVGWLRVPRGRAEDMAASRLKLDLGVPVLEQLVAARMLQASDEILPQQHARLLEGREILLAGLREYLPEWRVRVPKGGMALWCALPHSGSTALATAARAYDVALASGPNFAAGGGLDGWVRLPYVLGRDQLEQVAPRLAQAWADVQAGHVTLAREERGGRQSVARRIIA
ncbi:Transcriptional regulator, GntR family domain [Serinicoccus hydrothermalis]|uniref:Transcriptional regulator, GntR family domain n=1 Tax=Serinicoccus hydrothermalis TaxID=1758689 RepID=A0A1B1NAV8_9MICO|nr:PLP-dependent aminotransferase family protein [Serinicoccus hydrothermalis]ANS78570.1 Transcriptional regulator, GntR family domain [Serinicoccus hydrothermalis]